MKSDKVGKGEVLNIGGGEQYTILSVADIIGGQSVYLPARTEIEHSLAAIVLAKELIDWSPVKSFAEEVVNLR